MGPHLDLPTQASLTQAERAALDSGHKHKYLKGRLTCPVGLLIFQGNAQSWSDVQLEERFAHDFLLDFKSHLPKDGNPSPHHLLTSLTILTSSLLGSTYFYEQGFFFQE